MDIERLACLSAAGLCNMWLRQVHNSFYSGRISSSIPFREELLGQEKINEITKMNSILRRVMHGIR